MCTYIHRVVSAFCPRTSWLHLNSIVQRNAKRTSAEIDYCPSDISANDIPLQCQQGVHNKACITSHCCWGIHRWICDHSSVNRFSPCCLSSHWDLYGDRYPIISRFILPTRLAIIPPIEFRGCLISRWTAAICFSLSEFYRFNPHVRWNDRDVLILRISTRERFSIAGNISTHMLRLRYVSLIKSK